MKCKQNNEVRACATHATKIKQNKLAFLKDLGTRIGHHTREEKAGHYLLQLSVAVQRGNFISIRGSLGSPSSHPFL